MRTRQGDIALFEVAAEIVNGSVTVEQGLNEIHRTVVSPLHHPKDLQLWCDLADTLHRDEQGGVKVLSPAERDAVALDEARKNCVRTTTMRSNQRPQGPAHSQRPSAERSRAPDAEPSAVRQRGWED